MNTTTADAGFTSTSDHAGSRQLRRSADDRMLGGVAAGLARYLNADVTIVRIAAVAVTFFTGVGIPLYLAAWALVPEDGADESIAASWIAARRGPAAR